MTYEEIVEIVRNVYENADARKVFEHVAIQVNIEGEAEGIFYIEIADRKINVEPYEYHDKDALVKTTAQAIKDISSGKYTWNEALRLDLVRVTGDLNKLNKFYEIEFKNMDKKVIENKKNAISNKVKEIKTINSNNKILQKLKNR